MEDPQDLGTRLSIAEDEVQLKRLHFAEVQTALVAANEARKKLKALAANAAPPKDKGGLTQQHTDEILQDLVFGGALHLRPHRC